MVVLMALVKTLGYKAERDLNVKSYSSMHLCVEPNNTSY